MGFSEGYFLSDPIGDISHRNDLDKNRKIVCELLKNPFEIVLKGNFEYSIIEEAINEIKNRKIEKARRIWKTKNWLEFEKRRNIGIHRIENGFEISDYFYNLKLLITHLPVQYNSFIKSFPNISSIHLFESDLVDNSVKKHPMIKWKQSLQNKGDE